MATHPPATFTLMTGGSSGIGLEFACLVRGITLGV